MGRKAYLLVSGAVFGLVAVLHLIRVVYRLPVQLGSSSIPIWISWLGLVAAGVLCVWAIRLSRD